MENKACKKIKKLAKWEIACALEGFPGNKPWSSYSIATVWYDHYTRIELVNMYNDLVLDRDFFCKGYSFID